MPVSQKQFYPITFQERDFALLRSLFESRIMAAGHIATLHFDDKNESTQWETLC
jgi:hypothetical protein